MANTLEYIFSLQDKVSAKIGNITVTSEKMLGKFADLEKKTVSVNRTFNETGRTLGSLREKIALLQAEREWIPAEGAVKSGFSVKYKDLSAGPENGIDSVVETTGASSARAGRF